MLVKDFVKASYLVMRFYEDSINNPILYDFTWENDISEDNFINEYGDFTVEKFLPICDGIIRVVIVKSEV